MIRTSITIAALLALTACGAPGSPPDGELVDPNTPGTEADPQLEPDPGVIPVPPRCVLPRPGTQCHIPSDPVRARDLIVLAAYCPSVGQISVTSDDRDMAYATSANFTCQLDGMDRPLGVGAFNLDTGYLTHSADDGSLIVCEASDKPGSPARVTDVWRAVWRDGLPAHVPSHICTVEGCDFIDSDPCELPEG